MCVEEACQPPGANCYDGNGGAWLASASLWTAHKLPRYPVTAVIGTGHPVVLQQDALAAARSVRVRSHLKIKGCLLYTSPSPRD